MWGTLINGIQAASLEHVAMTTASWNGATSGSIWYEYNVDLADRGFQLAFLLLTQLVGFCEIFSLILTLTR
jgi:hypothetical protein